MSKNPDYVGSAETAAIKIVLKHVLWLMAHQQMGDFRVMNAWMEVLRGQCLDTMDKMSVVATGPVDEQEFRQDVSARINSFFNEMQIADVAA